jgi:DNA-directed RNA polymerase subunit L
MMLAEVLDLKDDQAELKIQEEDISVMYIVQHELLNNKNIEFAGVVLKHPLLRDYILRIAARKKAPIETIYEATANAAEIVREISSTIKAALKK